MSYPSSNQNHTEEAERQPLLIANLSLLRSSLSYSHELVGQIADRLEKVALLREDSKQNSESEKPSARDYVENMNELIGGSNYLNARLERVVRHLSTII